MLCQTYYSQMARGDSNRGKKELSLWWVCVRGRRTLTRSDLVFTDNIERVKLTDAARVFQWPGPYQFFCPETSRIGPHSRQNPQMLNNDAVTNKMVAPPWISHTDYKTKLTEMTKLKSVMASKVYQNRGFTLRYYKLLFENIHSVHTKIYSWD